jgi:hypothetical protein
MGVPDFGTPHTPTTVRYEQLAEIMRTDWTSMRWPLACADAPAFPALAELEPVAEFVAVDAELVAEPVFADPLFVAAGAAGRLPAVTSADVPVLVADALFPLFVAEAVFPLLVADAVFPLLVADAVLALLVADPVFALLVADAVPLTPPLTEPAFPGMAEAARRPTTSTRWPTWEARSAPPCRTYDIAAAADGAFTPTDAEPAVPATLPDAPALPTVPVAPLAPWPCALISM